MVPKASNLCGCAGYLIPLTLTLSHPGEGSVALKKSATIRAECERFC